MAKQPRFITDGCLWLRRQREIEAEQHELERELREIAHELVERRFDKRFAEVWL